MHDKAILEELYQKQQLSVAKIASILQSSESTVRRCLRLHSIPVRSKSEAAYLQHAKSFEIKQVLTDDERVLFGLGIGLYWGEGNKASKFSVRLGNTDPELIKCFIRFLTNLCGIAPEEIKYGLQVFNDSNPDEALAYWCDQLGCTRTAFHSTVVVSNPRGSGSYKKKSKYGVLQVYVNNKRFKAWLMEELVNFNSMPS